MAEKLPFFSIVVPTYRRPDAVVVCLESLAAQDYPSDRYEVVLVDDGSGAPPEEPTFRVQERLDVTLLEVAHGGPAAARNAGIARARGELIAFTDDDCAPSHDWLSRLADRFARTPDHAIGGHTVNQLVDNLFSQASQVLVDYLYSRWNPEGPGEARFFTSNNFAAPAHVLASVGGFDTSFPLAAAEDRELCDRWLERGHSLSYAPEAVVYHSHPMNLRQFCRQQAHYGRGAYHLKQLRAARGAGPVSFEPPDFYSEMMSFPLRHIGGARGFAICGLFTVAQLAGAMGFFAQRWKRP